MPELIPGYMVNIVKCGCYRVDSSSGSFTDSPSIQPGKDQDIEYWKVKTGGILDKNGEYSLRSHRKFSRVSACLMNCTKTLFSGHFYNY